MAQQHVLPGTVARYIVRNSNDPDLLQLVFLWRTQTLPPEKERRNALQALRADLADFLDWDTACSLEGTALLNT